CSVADSESPSGRANRRSRVAEGHSETGSRRPPNCSSRSPTNTQRSATVDDLMPVPERGSGRYALDPVVGVEVAVVPGGQEGADGQLLKDSRARPDPKPLDDSVVGLDCGNGSVERVHFRFSPVASSTATTSPLRRGLPRVLIDAAVVANVAPRLTNCTFRDF